MANYIVLGNFTDQGIRNIKDTEKRAEDFKSMAKDVGVTVKDVFWTLGQYDLAITMDAPDDESVTALGLSVGSLGNVRTQTLRAYSAKEMRKIQSKVV